MKITNNEEKGQQNMAKDDKEAPKPAPTPAPAPKKEYKLPTLHHTIYHKTQGETILLKLKPGASFADAQAEAKEVKKVSGCKFVGMEP